MRSIASIDEVPANGVALLYVGTSWCRHCRTTAPAVEKAAAARLGVMEAVGIDSDEDPDALAALGARTIPQLALYRDGVRIAQRESADEAALEAWLVEHGVTPA